MKRTGTHFAVRRQFDLTPRQRDVIELLARGYTNGQIGEALGISLDGAKWHVSEIIARLGVSSREEAVECWRAYQKPTARLSRALRVIAPASLLRWGIGGAAVLTAAVGMLIIVAMALTESYSDDMASQPPTAAPATSAVPTQTVTPTPAGTVIAASAVECLSTDEKGDVAFGRTEDGLLCLSWEDRWEDEAAYVVRLFYFNEQLERLYELPADTVTFVVPGPDQPRLDESDEMCMRRKDYELTVNVQRPASSSRVGGASVTTHCVR